MLGAVGRDAAGAQLVEALRAAGVDADGVLRHDESPTGTAFIVVDAKGENQIVVAAGANAFLTARHLEANESRFQKAKAVVTQLEVPLETVAAALRLARAHGALAILNPAPAVPQVEALLQSCDWLIPNEQEATLLLALPEAALPPGQLAARLRERSEGAGIVITLGAAGAWVDCASFSGLVRGFPVTAVDTVGAGDTFIGAFATRLLEGAAPAEAARFACAAGALSVTRRGAQASAPTRDEVDSFLRRNG
jgi:ribokinase